MARTYAVTIVEIPATLIKELETKKQAEGRYGSRTAYVSEILSRYVSGALVSEELLRAKIEAEVRKTILDELQGREVPKRPAVEVKAHRPAKENRESKHKAA
jgi:hypothetical protein